MRSWRKIRGLTVVTLDEGAVIGRFQDFQFDLETGHIYGWRLKGNGVFGRTGGVAAKNVQLLGRDVALLRGSDTVEWLKGKAGLVDGRGWASLFLKLSVITRAGDSVGHVRDLALDGARVVALLLDNNTAIPLEGRLRLGPAAAVIDSRDTAVPVPEDEAERALLWARFSAPATLAATEGQ